MRRRLIGLRTILGGGLIGVVAINAAFLQDGRHPAPLFTPNGRLESNVPLPPRPDHYRVSVGERERTGSLPGGDTSAMLAALQKELHELGLYDGPVDGLDGPRTQAAVSAYQKAQGLPASGVADYKLLQHVRLSNDAARPSNERTASLPPGSQPHILALQRVLADLGYAPGPIDGIVGLSTREAIKRFEQHYGLPVTGEVSQRLIQQVQRVSGVALLPAGEG